MPGLFTDVKKTMMGVFALLGGVILFTDQSGLGGGAVAGADMAKADHSGDLAQQPGQMPQPAASAQGAAPSWFAASDGESDEADPPPPPVNNVPAPPPPNPGEIRRPEPTGPDFPPGLRH